MPVRLLVACELFLLFVSVLPSGLFTKGPSESVESLLFIITLMRLMGSAASWRALMELPRPGGQFIPALWEEEDDDEKAADDAVEVNEEWKLLPEVPEFAMQFFFKDEEEDEREDSAPYFSRELFLRFLVEPRLIALLLLTLTPPLSLLLLLLLLLLAPEIANAAAGGSLTQTCLGPVRDLMDLFEPGAEGSEDEYAEGIWGEDEDTCLDEPPPPYVSCSPALCDVTRAFRVVPYDSVGLLSCDWL